MSIDTYSKLSSKNTSGINGLTAHHMPSKQFMKNLGIEGYGNGDGALTMLIEAQGSGVGRHNRTLTYKKGQQIIPEYFNLSPAEALKHDIDELRELFIQDGVYGADVEKALQSYVSQIKTKYPNIQWTN